MNCGGGGGEEDTLSLCYVTFSLRFNKDYGLTEYDAILSGNLLRTLRKRATLL
jgi:hypothetical protein